MGLDHDTLRAIADAGFSGVETVDVPGGDPVAARRALDDLGLAVASAHTWADIATSTPWRAPPRGWPSSGRRG